MGYSFRAPDRESLEFAGILQQMLCSWRQASRLFVAMGQNPNRTPSEHPNPTTKIGSQMAGEFNYQPKWDPKTVLTPTALLELKDPYAEAAWMPLSMERITFLAEGEPEVPPLQTCCQGQKALVDCFHLVKAPGKKHVQ